MSKKYSQFKAFISIVKASLTATFSNATTVFFGVLFPFIFIMVFGFFQDGGTGYKIAISENSDKNTDFVENFKKIEQIKIEKNLKDSEQKKLLEKGDLTAILEIKQKENSALDVNVKISTASKESGVAFLSILNGIAGDVNLKASGFDPSKKVINISYNEISGRKYKAIDFILPGMLGFSLMTSAIFATTFVFINLRNTLVIKRMMATPAKRYNIVLGEGVSRLVFAIMQTVIIIGIGTLLLGFILVNGWVTFVNMLLMSIIGLIVFLGFGFIVSSVANNEQSAAPIANLFTMPQMLLSGVFFPVDLLPDWLQPISKALPLAHLSEAMRNIAFNGDNLWDVRSSIFVLLIWAVIIYAVAIKVFKWEKAE